MKKRTNFILFTAILVVIVMAMKPMYETTKATAEVFQEEGLYIFYRSKPVKEYDYIGTYKVGMVWDDKPKLLFAKIVKKVKKEFPEAQAVIIDNDMGKCDAIKFK